METMCWEIQVDAGGFSLTMRQVSVVQGTRPLRSTAPVTFAIITLVWYLNMELYKEDHWPTPLNTAQLTN